MTGSFAGCAYGPLNKTQQADGFPQNTDQLLPCKNAFTDMVDDILQDVYVLF